MHQDIFSHGDSLLSRARFDIPDVPSRWRKLRWLLLLVLPLPLLYGLFTYQAQGIADRAIELSLGAGQLNHGLSWVDLRGNIRGSGLEFQAEGATSPWRAAEFEVGTAGWAWWLSQTFNLDLRTRPIDRLRVEFRQLEIGLDREPALGELGPIGASAAPFEAEGCSGARHWSDEELREMEIDPLASRLSFDFLVQGQLLQTEITYEVADSSRTRLTRSQRMPMPLTVLLTDQFPRLTLQEAWQIEDLGFVRKRTKYCAQRNSIAQREMIERHLQSVSRLLETVGLEAVPVAAEFYRLYARDGGDLSLELRYTKPWAAHPDATLGLDQETLAGSHAIMQRGEESAAFIWPHRPIRALPEWSAGMPTYDALSRELNGGGVDLGIDTAVPPLWSRRPAAKVDLEGLGLPDLDGAYRLLVNETATDAEPAVNSAPDSPPTAAPDATPKVDQAAPRPTAPNAPSPASTTTPAPKTVIIGRQKKDVEWDDLPGLIGKRLRITTQTGAKRYAELIEARSDEILIRTRIGGGIAEYRIKREAFRSAALDD